LEFDDFILDVGRRQLLRSGQEIHLGAKAYELLALLLNHRPRAVSKAEIRDRLWPDTFVSESNLSTVVTELRAALGDEAKQPRYLRTVYGFGYAFCGLARDRAALDLSSEPGGRSPLRLRWGRIDVPLSQGENVLGRTHDAVLWLDSPMVSRRHAAIMVASGGASIRDLGSKNGTYVRGERIESPCPLADGDEIRLGDVVIRFHVLPADSTASLLTHGKR
jgi:DNA-binding winged helix-turn-helix (wHTH) protein